jgi:hypothetical protein
MRAVLQINGDKIGKGKTMVLRNGNEIAFGSTSGNEPNDDFRAPSLFSSTPCRVLNRILRRLHVPADDRRARSGRVRVL